MPAAMEKTDVPGVYKRGGRYVFSYRKRGRQHWGSAATKAEARRLKRNAETDVERGEHPETSRNHFGEYARAVDRATTRGARRGAFVSRRGAGIARMLEQRLIPYFDVERELRLTQIEPRDVKALVRWLADQSGPGELPLAPAVSECSRRSPDSTAAPRRPSSYASSRLSARHYAVTARRSSERAG